MKKRAIAGIVLVALLGISGTSLGVHRVFLEGRLEASKATTDLSHSLEAIDGVESVSAVYTPLAVPEPTVKVSVAFAKASPVASWSRARKAIDEAMRTAQLTGADASATFRETDGGATAIVDPLAVTPTMMVTELTTWHSMLSSVGDRVSLRLGRENATSGLGRRYTVKTTADVSAVAARWPAAGFAVNSTLATTWTSPGIQLATVPTRAMMSTVADLTKVVPLVPAATLPKKPGVYAVVLSDLGGYKVDFISAAHGRPADLALDEHLAQGTHAALAGGASRVEWVRAGGTATLVVGACQSYELQGRTVTPTFSANSQSSAFAAGLASAGVSLPGNLRPGVCQA